MTPGRRETLFKSHFRDIHRGMHINVLIYGVWADIASQRGVSSIGETYIGRTAGSPGAQTFLHDVGRSIAHPDLMYRATDGYDM